MRRIALINQKGGVGKTTSTVNLGAALALQGRRVVVIDLDPQANLSLHLDVQLRSGEPSIYTVLLGDGAIEDALRDTATTRMRLVPSCIDLSGAELELSNAFGREMILRDALDQWEQRWRDKHGEAPADYVLLDCPPSLGLLSINGLVAAREALLVVQTEFFALQGLTKLVDIVQLLRRRLNPSLDIRGILPCLYDNRTKLAREVLAELRAHFPGKVFTRAVSKNIKLAEAPSYGQTIFQYAPESSGASDYSEAALELIASESSDAELAARFAPAEPEVPQPPRVEATVTIRPARTSRASNNGANRARRNGATQESASETGRGEVEERAEADGPAAARSSERASSARSARAPSNDVAQRDTPAAATTSNASDELPDLPPDAEWIPRFVDS